MKIPSTTRTAVAPVLATLMMIAVAVAMSVIIFVWSQGFLSQTSSAAGGQQSQQNIAAQSSVSLELSVFTTGTTAPASATCGGAAATEGIPKFTIIVRNVGSVTETLGSLTINGVPGNAGFKGTVTIASVGVAGTGSSTNPPYGSVTAQTDGTWKYSTGAGSGTLGNSVTIAKASSQALYVCNTSTSAVTNTAINSGDIINIKLTTTAGTFATQQYTVP